MNDSTGAIVFGFLVLTVMMFVVGLHAGGRITTNTTKEKIGCFWNCKHIDASVVACTKQDDNKVIAVCKNNKDELVVINFEVNP